MPPRERSTRPAVNKPSQPEISEAALLRIFGEIENRALIARKLGKSFSGTRDLYEQLGYPRELKYEDHLACYKRGGIGRTVVNLPCDDSWGEPPQVLQGKQQGKKDQTPFEKEFADLVKRLNLWHYLYRVDRLAGIGRYSVLFLGWADALDFEKEATGKELAYIQVFSENAALIDKYVEDTKDPRYGLPLTYKVTMGAGTNKNSRLVHWSRVLHVAEDRLDDENEGQPRLEAPFNRLMDLETISGGSSEMFWRGAFPPLALLLDPGVDLTTPQKAEMQTQSESFIHGLTRMLRLKGVKPEQLASEVADPSNHIEMLLTIISAATGIPKRIMLGSERGELASSQDTKHWNKRIARRRNQHCEAVILRPFIDRCILRGALPAVGDEGYSVEWPPLEVEGQKEAAERSALRTSALTDYCRTPGADRVIPPTVFLRLLMQLTPEQIEEIAQLVAVEDSLLDEEDEDAAADPVGDEEEEETDDASQE